MHNSSTSITDAAQKQKLKEIYGPFAENSAMILLNIRILKS
jgi:hypothetical protein